MAHQQNLSRFLLEAISNTVRRSLNDLSNQLEDYLLRDVEDIDRETRYSRTHTCEYKNTNKEHTSCPICLDDYVDNSIVSQTKCKHLFHEKCLKSWTDKNNTCPNCRNNL